MKNIIALVMLLTVGVCHAQIDSIYQMQQQQIETLEQENRALERDVQQLTRQLNGLQMQINNLSAEFGQKIESQQMALDGISNEVNANAESIANTSTTLGERINQADGKTDVVADSLRGKTTGGIIMVVALLILSVLLFLLLRKRISKGDLAIEEIDHAQKRLQEESVKLDGKMVELLEGQLKIQEAHAKSEKVSTPDHSLVIAVANEVARIEQNLNNMDASVRGVSNLKNRAAAIIASLNSKGYEIPRLLGEPFHDGYNMDAEMELDESLPVGTQIIRRVIKPQINYEGKMIQAAKVVVAFNE